MNELRHPTVIFLCGWAGSGKTSIADRLKKILKIHCANIDAVRAALTGNLFRPVFEKHPHSRIKIIHCVPVNDTPEEVMRMLKKREEEEGYVAGVSTLERYLEVKGRWKEPPLPFEKIATWGSGNSIEDSARQAAEYVLRDT